ncbi:MAG: LptF/LptG family permease [Ignavibacteriaceae bacterium]|jgi:lipopolysaccharide export system permease protein|nr:LptF/LptG family permease [Ignavibacteriaceae bacterium]
MIAHRYILKAHLIPFVFSTLTLMGIFLLQFMMKFADRLVGKGLDTWLLIQLVVFNLSWMLVLVIPMATLVATLMAYGNFSQNNEITILKSSGVSLYRMMSGPFIASILVAILLFLFNDKVLPDANHQARLLMQDISQQKPTLSLEPGFFSQEVSNYAILVREINSTTNELSGLTIYDYTTPAKINVVTANKGKIYFTADQKNLVMDLWQGEIHESDVKNSGLYRKLIFDKHRIVMDGSQFSFHQSQGGIRGERELDVDTMRTIVSNFRAEREQQINFLNTETNKFFLADSSFISVFPKTVVVRDDRLILARVLDKIRTAKNNITSKSRSIEFTDREIEKYEVEIYKKYSIPAACIIFILIGAPLGVMVRKGGFGVAAGISLFFFLIYWAFLIGGEKLAERGFFSPFIGMWAANFVLGFLGIILTIKTNRETVTISFNFFKKLVPKRFKLQQETDENY